MMGKTTEGDYVLRVTIAHNGQEALEVYGNYHGIAAPRSPDAVLDSHGVMKAMKRKIECPIVIVSISAIR